MDDKKGQLSKPEQDIFDDMTAAWLAFCRLQRENPSANGQYAMNILARIIREARGEAERRAAKQAKAGQMTIEEWVNFIDEG